MLYQAKKSHAEGPGVLNAPEACRKFGPVLQRLELALGEGIVVRDVRPAVRLGHAQVTE